MWILFSVFADTIQVCLPNGKVIFLKITTKPAAPRPAPPQPDRIQAYGQQVLELGLLFKNFEEVCTTPNRSKMIRTLKLMMLLIRADNSQAKYADEILRFLVQQLVVLSEHDAYEMFFSLFVNMKGQLTSSMPADIWMERLVRITKKHIKSMISNKSEKNIFRRTAALAGLDFVTTNFDEESAVYKPSSKHSKAAVAEDEQIMLNDLRQVRPFKYQVGRAHDSFPKAERSVLAELHYSDLHSWMSRRIVDHGSSLVV